MLPTAKDQMEDKEPCLNAVCVCIRANPGQSLHELSNLLMRMRKNVEERGLLIPDYAPLESERKLYDIANDYVDFKHCFVSCMF